MTSPANYPGFPQQVAFLAQNILQDICAQFDTPGGAAQISAPTVRFVQPGVIPVVPVAGWSCAVPGQITIALRQITQGGPGALTGAPQDTPATRRTATFWVEIWRPVPGLTSWATEPASADVTAAAADPMTGTMTDALALFIAADLFRINAPTGLLVQDEAMVIGPITTLGPEGATAGTRMELQVDLLALSM